MEYDYSLDKLQKHMPQSLAVVEKFIILGYYNQYHQKMQLYREGVIYGSLYNG